MLKQYTQQDLANIYQSIAPEGLWTPGCGTPNPQAAPPAVAVWLRYSDLVPDSGDLKQRYWDALQKVPVIDTVVLLSMINGVLSSGSADPVAHRMLNEKFLPKDLNERAVSYKLEGPVCPAVFTRLGCLHLMRHLILYGLRTNENPTPQVQDVGELVLLANEFLQGGPPLRNVQPTDSWVAALLTPTWDIYNPKDLAYALSRIYVMLQEILPGSDPEVRTLSRAAGIAPDQISIDGIPLADFLALVFGLYAHGRKMASDDARHALFDVSRIFEKIGPAQQLPQFMRARSLSPSQFREQLGEGLNPSQDNFYQELGRRSFMTTSLNYFRRCPLLMLDNNLAAILDLQFLADLLTSGVYWSIFNSIPKDQRETFQQLWGRVFELYAVGLLSDAYPAGSRLLESNLTFPGGQVDALLDFGKEALVFEMKSSFLTEDAKRRGDHAAFERDVYKKFVYNDRSEPKGVAQLARCCKALENRLIPTSMSPTWIYPVLVAQEPASEVPCFNSHLNEIFKSELGGVPHVKPLSVMSINEFDEVLGHVSAGVFTWADLLNCRFDGERVNPLSVHQALYNLLRSKGTQPVRNETRRAKFEKATAEITRRYQPREGK